MCISIVIFHVTAVWAILLNECLAVDDILATKDEPEEDVREDEARMAWRK